MASGNKNRIDMTHGFMKGIIKNQVDRDNYEKEIQSIKPNEKPSRMTPTTNRPRKPDAQVYIPRTKQESIPDETNGSSFCVEFEDQHGVVHKLTIHKTDHVQDVAKRFGQQHNLPPPMVRALTIRLQEELATRERPRHGNVT